MAGDERNAPATREMLMRASIFLPNRLTPTSVRRGKSVMRRQKSHAILEMKITCDFTCDFSGDEQAMNMKENERKIKENHNKTRFFLQLTL
jgi:hypothetical protein